MPFHNPYHFVPVVDREHPKSDAHVTHDRYVEKTFSGRVLCRLVTQDPVVVGGRRNEENERLVKPFELVDGQPAIPASSLRGLISSIAEAASNSALRVLENRPYSYRMSTNKPQTLPPGALGMLLLKDGRFRLRPLALPPIKRNSANSLKIPPEYCEMFTAQNRLKVYVNGYSSIRCGASTSVVISTGSFLDKCKPDSFSSAKREYWYMRVPPNQDSGSVHSRGDYTLGYRPLDDNPLDEQEYNRRGRPVGYVRGILRVLGIDNRASEMPTTKKHEIFIPYPVAMESEPSFDAHDAIERFHGLADERTAKDSNLPFELKGMQRTGDIRLREGDIVFFRPDGKRTDIVAEVSLSSIWRRRVDGTSHDFFRQISPELLPFNPERKATTIAEDLFGYVEQRKPGKVNNEPVKALAGRLRFHSALLHSSGHASPYEEPVTLKVLDSPKPPCPSMYFKWKNKSPELPKFIAKDALKLGDCLPQGRKFYLHRDNVSEKPWKTNDPNATEAQKNIVTPVRAGQTFFFHIDFTNLSEEELGLLCYALRPTTEFRHKLGMGKSIGLGRVQIDPIGLFLVDRKKRYSEDDPSVAARYHQVFVEDGEQITDWPEEYDVERRAAGNVGRASWLHERRQKFVEQMDQSIRKALELLGDPAKVRHPVQTPKVRHADPEQETYRWFVANEVARSQALIPLPTEDGLLPTLEELAPLRR